MTFDEFALLEKELEDSYDDVKTFLKQKDISTNTYYYWKRRTRELKDSSASTVGQFLPIDVQGSGLAKYPKGSKKLKQPLVTQGKHPINHIL